MTATSINVPDVEISSPTVLPLFHSTVINSSSVVVDVPVSVDSGVVDVALLEGELVPQENNNGDNN